MATAVLVGAGIAAAALVGRAAIRAFKATSGTSLAGDAIHSATGKPFLRGGFEPKMSRREAALLLGVKESPLKDKLKQAHRSIMLSNHPDRNGSPYLASKINEAKELLEKGK
ncbi:hypothetical protein BATDEDRAFT_8120 [Batrachochytrium dendrobatidis JAM81]|uniref:Mitochondrial import inner membrane translocase subunit TIM14 n=2 Tax=Batrachochytrium dendrobatidis TaxID=109871 RepID=F4NTD9_BATDJ|nr:uncharacterized protein BATDEDRAFT_8120 [Batrachochytrium dendrobatidis JAM81]EGF83901.1 hypothetical protein BATDEDRAFT_8120 [Batrachochytrium dendrobatidis JAM81]KAJ8331382.1 hypothetical protein O5D80_000309 [Batrachochytrium dendrobatidis]KAK5671828.1 hypothetical protein QVD99_001659 [Batrachochytrium dendrobatidis]OAJ36170.1 hypothetical protein BDEG_20372 [Batrachochytrium dendrobatidis JEL423]|eukprot:XP_006674971.1 hypothetical protein BATDEDRAFT_8120 [Batrachochytrium dendrobatidis JAM81]